MIRPLRRWHARILLLLAVLVPLLFAWALLHRAPAQSEPRPSQSSELPGAVLALQAVASSARRYCA